MPKKLLLNNFFNSLGKNQSMFGQKAAGAGNIFRKYKCQTIRVFNYSDLSFLRSSLLCDWFCDKLLLWRPTWYAKWFVEERSNRILNWSAFHYRCRWYVFLKRYFRRCSYYWRTHSAYRVPPLKIICRIPDEVLKSMFVDHTLS